MPLYLVRHAKAGSRSDWEGDDTLRPLSKNGWRQAEAIANYLAKAPVPQILSSPYVRCVQTVEPLAKLHGLVVEETDVLAEGEGFEAVLQLLEGAGDHAVLCSHGDIIPETIGALVRRGMHVRSRPEWRKGSIWVLEREGGAFVKAKALPPPL